MRTIFFLFLLAPFLAAAQNNRSANELARESIIDYLFKKMFAEKDYTAVSFGNLEHFADKKHEVEWTLEHRFEIKGQQSSFDGKSVPVKTSWYIIFYLDHQMKVVRARSYSSTSS